MTEPREQLAELRTAPTAGEEPARLEAAELADELNGTAAGQGPDPEVVTGIRTRLRSAAMVALPAGAALAQIWSMVDHLMSGSPGSISVAEHGCPISGRAAGIP